MNKKRIRESINRDDYWMGMAFMFASKSNFDPQHGCVIVDANNEMVSHGCESAPNHFKSFDHILHAEMKALFESCESLCGSTVYVNYAPCYDCCFYLFSRSVKRIVYYPNGILQDETYDLLKASYAQVEAFKGNLNWMRDYFKTLNIF